MRCLPVRSLHSRIVARSFAALLLAGSSFSIAAASQAQITLPSPSQKPLTVDLTSDPVLGLSNISSSAEDFRTRIKSAVLRHPSLDEAEASAREAVAAKNQVRSEFYPTVDVTLTSYRIIARQFGDNSLDNIVERTRPNARSDAFASINQLIYDFGATADRFTSAKAQIDSAIAGIDSITSQVALNTIGAWYDLYSRRTLLRLTNDYRASAAQGSAQMQQRIDQGASAPADMARVDVTLASLDLRIARYQREVANAEARFEALTGVVPPADLGRAPLLGSVPPTVESARMAAAEKPEVRAARAQVYAAEKAADAARKDTLPSITGQVAAGRYGVLENQNDYDVRGIVTLRSQLFGGQDERADQLRARAEGARARSARIGEEASRDAAIAYSDLRALNAQLQSLEQAYIASRTTRDAIVQRFAVSRGNLLDVLGANDTYFAAAASYLDVLSQRDTAYYVLLAQTGELLDALELEPATQVMLYP